MKTMENKEHLCKSMKINETHNTIIKYRPWTSGRITVFNWPRRADQLNTVIIPELFIIMNI